MRVNSAKSISALYYRTNVKTRWLEIDSLGTAPCGVRHSGVQPTGNVQSPRSDMASGRESSEDMGIHE